MISPRKLLKVFIQSGILERLKNNFIKVNNNDLKKIILRK